MLFWHSSHKLRKWLNSIYAALRFGAGSREWKQGKAVQKSGREWANKGSGKEDEIEDGEDEQSLAPS